MLRLKARHITWKLLDAVPFEHGPNSFDPVFYIILKTLEDSYLQGRTDQINKVSFAYDDEGHLKRTFEEVV